MSASKITLSFWTQASSTSAITITTCEFFSLVGILWISNAFVSFGFKTLERSYLLRLNGRVAERPQQMLMRVAVGIHGRDIERVIETYVFFPVSSGYLLTLFIATI